MILSMRVHSFAGALSVCFILGAGSALAVRHHIVHRAPVQYIVHHPAVEQDWGAPTDEDETGRLNSPVSTPEPSSGIMILTGIGLVCIMGTLTDRRRE